MIIGIHGRLGSGKSALMALIGKFFQEKTGQKLYCVEPYYVDTMDRQVRNLEEIKTCNTGILLWDEIQLTLNSRKFMLNSDFLDWLVQTRKDDLIVIYTSQIYRQVDYQIRQITDYLFIAEKLALNSHRFTLVDIWTDKMIGTYYLEDISNLYGVFNSYQKMQKINKHGD